MDSGRSDIVVLGFDDCGRVAGIPRLDRTHTGIFGEVGSGKSTVNTILINQNINRGEGFLVVDPHGSLAQDVLRMVPSSEKDRVVYISLDSARRWGKTVKINPLEVGPGCDRYLVAMNLVNALRNIYRDSWGPQLEALLRNGANALVEISGSTLRDLVRMITDEGMRNTYLARVSNRDVIHFWSVLFPQQYRRDAGRSAYNKLDKILSTPQLAAMLDTPVSTIEFGDVMESGKWVIVDLSSGGSDDVVSFVGTILINAVYVAARKRFGRENSSDPFFMYVDEAHLFAPFALRELLNTMRKANVKVAITSQTVNSFPRELAKEISALARTIVCFKVDTETANAFKTIMPVSVEDLTSMTQGRFAFYSQGKRPFSGVLKATPVVDRSRGWEEAALYSTELYGEATSLQKYVLPPKAENGWPPVAPLEASILLLLYDSDNKIARDEISYFVSKMFPVGKREAFARLDDILVNRLRLVDRQNMKGKREGQLVTCYSLSELAYHEVFSQAAAGRRAGSDLHLATIFVIMGLQQKRFRFCIPDLGNKLGQRPDLLVFEPRVVQKTGTTELYDPDHWSERVTAVEVEVDPTKHPSQLVENFRKNFKLGYFVRFIVFSQKHRNFVVDTMDKNKIETIYYEVVTVAVQSIGRISNMQKNSSALTMEDLDACKVLEGSTVKPISENWSSH